MTVAKEIVATILRFYPNVQGIYCFGSSGTEHERADSDVDLAILLPWDSARDAGNLALKECWSSLVQLTGRHVDLVNLRRVNTVFQLQVIGTGNLIYTADLTAVQTFEMLTLSFYQKLEEERAPIIAEILEMKRILHP